MLRILLIGCLSEEVVHGSMTTSIFFIFTITQIAGDLNTRLLLRDILLNSLQINQGAHLGTTNDVVTGVRVLADRVLGVLDDITAVSRAAKIFIPLLFLLFNGLQSGEHSCESTFPGRLAGNCILEDLLHSAFLRFFRNQHHSGQV